MRQSIHARGIGSDGIVLLLREGVEGERSPSVGFGKGEDAVRRHGWA